MDTLSDRNNNIYILTDSNIYHGTENTENTENTKYQQ